MGWSLVFEDVKFILLKKAIIISTLSIIVVMLMFATKIVNVPTVEATEGASYDEIVVYGILMIGVLSLIVAWMTFHLHVVAGIIPFGLGVSTLLYGIWIMMCKGMI